MTTFGKYSAREEAVARCLAKLNNGGFISAADWVGDIGERFRRNARSVLMTGNHLIIPEVVETLDRFDAGIRSGGLPPDHLR